MEDPPRTRTMTRLGLLEAALEFVMGYIDDPRDRDAISLVCRRWYEIDALSRKHVTIAFCYTTTPARLRQRFPRLVSLKLKGKPRASMFNLIPEDWGGYAGPWVRELTVGFDCLKALHFRRMIFRDEDLEVLAVAWGAKLESLKLDKCSGFSTDGLLHVTHYCRCLKTLFLEESIIEERDAKWLHELAMHNTVLETLNFYTTDLNKISVQDLELIATNCHSLASIKISDTEILHLKDFFRSSTALEEFAGGSFNEPLDAYKDITLPRTLCRLGLSYLGNEQMHLVFPIAARLRKLDLLYSFLDTEDHCQLIQQCPNLEILEARNVIGDRGLEVVSQSCKRLKRLRIERGEDEGGMEDEQGIVSQRGLSALAQGCHELEYIAVHVSDITNASLELIGRFCKNLNDFRIVLLEQEQNITELPLDNGVRALLMGCEKLRRFAFYVRAGALSDVGLRYIGQHSRNVRWMLLGCVGETDAGFLEFAGGCPNLQKLEMRGCCFTERTLAVGVKKLTNLRYLWVQQLGTPLRGDDLMVMRDIPFWNIEVFPYNGPPRPHAITVEDPYVEADHILAYHSFAGQRRDYPNSVVPLHPPTPPE